MEFEGILLIDKPANWTSHDVCNFVKRRFRIKKVGHTGTLDPQATGVLVLLLGKYTKYSSQLMSEDKQYSGTILLGTVTDSQDITGNVLCENSYSNITENDLCLAVNKFKGEIMQIPPMVSAIKINGKRLYTLARKGKVLKRDPRPVKISEFILTGFSFPEVFFKVLVSKGTYVRTLVHDLGALLGCGACLSALKRTRNGKFDILNCVSIDVLKKIENIDELKKYIIYDL